MEKRILTKEIYYQVKDNPFTWGEIKEHSHLFEDKDIVYAAVDENDHDYFLQVTREVEETDEEFNSRIKRVKESEKRMKERRYEKFIELKAEFEGDQKSSPNNHDDDLLAEKFENFAKEVTSSREKALEFLQGAGILDGDGNLTEDYK